MTHTGTPQQRGLRGFLNRIFGDDAVERSIHEEELDHARARMMACRNCQDTGRVNTGYDPETGEFSTELCPGVGASYHAPMPRQHVSPWVGRALANDLPVFDTTNGADAYRETR
jgi:hypothetical protein